jgi:hypothetical protein
MVPGAAVFIERSRTVRAIRSGGARFAAGLTGLVTISAGLTNHRFYRANLFDYNTSFTGTHQLSLTRPKGFLDLGCVVAVIDCSRFALYANAPPCH